ncbi:MAG: prevent-host-death protein [Actinobacteria bacterium]|nr:prevent-host-death protein [Actinomycetota bacterium]
MIKSVTANELKTKGLAALDSAISGNNEAVITVRGKSKYIVLPFERYNHFRECELESALQESRNDMLKGRYIEETVEQHIKRITSG